MHQKPKVSIIILNWNQPEFTVNCVKSVLDQNYPDFEILLVDNGSEDNSVDIFEKEFGKNKKIRILETGKNLGYAGGNNEGVKNSGGEYVVILNNDTVVEKDWLKWLVGGIESDEKIGAVSSVEIREGKKIDVDFTSVGNTSSLLGYHARYRHKKKMNDTTLVDLFSLTGVSFIYRKDLANPPFDPEYFIYAEDMYLGWLLRMKGFMNKLSTKSIVNHFHNISKKDNMKVSRYFVYLGERNRLMNFFILYEFKNILKISPLLLSGIVLLNLFEPRKSPYRLRSYLWILLNMWKIIIKRGHIQKQRIIQDSEIISIMSCKFYEETGVKKSIHRVILILINNIFCLYCKLVGLKTIENG